jgi:hypothetical protein
MRGRVDEGRTSGNGDDQGATVRLMRFGYKAYGYRLSRFYLPASGRA